MSCDFDQIIDRRHTDSAKWRYYDEDVIPLWVADMDFAVPEPVLRALEERVAHGIFGYGLSPDSLCEVIQEHLARLYGWRVETDEIFFLPGVVTGFNRACYAVGTPGDEVLVETPVYPPMLAAPGNNGRTCKVVPLVEEDERYEHDFDGLERAILDTDTGRTSLFLLCNPHNPVGRVFETTELERLAEICLRHDVVICSDEIHCDIVYQNHRHVPIASLAPEIGAQTITLFAPSKTFNVAGLSCSVGVIQNSDLRARLEQAGAGLVPHVNVLGYTAALAAYRDGQPWLDALLVYLEANRDYLLEYIATHMPGIKCKKPEGTFLAWLDCREADVPGNSHQFFLERARVALNDGARFGAGGEGFVRLNFGCPRAILTEALERMRTALEKP
ncbi:MAG: PatB family C-S lyase [Anaerolineae bacterium]|nr:PatB family C-S lyase [Anaerolineae bacterium]